MCPDNATIGALSGYGSSSLDSLDSADSSDSSDSATSMNATLCLFNASASSDSSDSSSVSLDSLDSSDSSDSSDSGESYASDFCGTVSSSGGSSSDSGASSRRRRRALLSESGDSDDSDDSSDSSSGGASATLIAVSEALVETCLNYSIELYDEDDCPVDILEIFLPLCENNDTTFNSSLLTEEDLLLLILDFKNDSNVASLIATQINGTWGYLLTLLDDSMPSFELCLQNITVNADNVGDLTGNVTELETSTGFVTISPDMGCPITGLPCFNFFFSADCPTADGNYTDSSDSIDSSDSDSGIEGESADDVLLEQLANMIAEDLLEFLEN